MASSPPLAPEGGAAISKNVGEVRGSTAGRLRRSRDLHPDVAEVLLGGRCTRPAKKEPGRKAGGEEEEEEDGGDRVWYDCVFEDEGALEEGRVGGLAAAPPKPPRLVWAKVRSYPWWPAQVVDTADASVAAQMERRRSGAVLVAFFWDNTFAWVADDAAELRPFRAGFPRLASNVLVAAALGAALGEVARRVDAGLSCGCATSGDGATEKQAMIENAGVREGACKAVVDAAFTRDALRGEAFVGYISSLALAPLAGAARLDLTVATAQLKAFTRWRGARGLPEYAASYGIEDIADDGAMDATPAGRAIASSKRGRSRTGRDDGGAGAGAGAGACAAQRKTSRCRPWRSAACGSVVDEALQLDDDFEPPPKPPSHRMATRMGRLMSRAAQQMSVPSPAIRRAGRGAPSPSSVTRCTSWDADHAPPPPAKLHDGDDAPPLPGLVLNFAAGPTAVPPASELVKIFSRFGPIKETRALSSSFVVIFKRAADTEAAFSGTATVAALSLNLVSFRLTYSPPPPAAAAAPVHPRRRRFDTDGKDDEVPAEAELRHGCNADSSGHCS